MQSDQRIPNLAESIRETLTVANRLKQEPIVIGNFSFSLMGIPIFTQDVDLFLFEGEAHAIDLAAECCLAGFLPRKEFVFRHPHQGFIQLHHRQKKGDLIQVDIMFPIGKDALWDSLNKHSVPEFNPDWKVRYRKPAMEDIILLKSFAGRNKDFLAIATLVTDVPDRINISRINAVLEKSKIIPSEHERKLRELLAEIKG